MKQITSIRLLVFLILSMILAAIFAFSLRAQAADWRGVRDADLYFRVSAEMLDKSLSVSWKPAWIARTQQEALYWYGPGGALIKKIEIGKNQPSGRQSLAFSKGAGDYRLAVPGHSYRYYRAVSPEGVASVIEPAKVHVFAKIAHGDEMFTRLGPANKNSSIAFKSHEGTNTLSISECTSGVGRRLGKLDCREITKLASAGSDRYQNFASVPVPAASLIKLAPSRTGKVAIWIDGAPNIFSQSPSEWFLPEWRPGRAELLVSDAPIGPTTKTGVYFEFFKPGADQLKAAQRLQPKFSNFYAPEDVLENDLDRDLPYLEAYRSIGVDDFITILNDTRRDSISDDAEKSVKFFTDYVLHHDKAGIAPPIVAFVDEPNLRYGGFDQFERYFAGHVSKFRAGREPGLARVKIAAPESSGMLNGPTKRTIGDHSGFAWTRQLFKNHWDSIDIISWHMWKTRDLEAIDIFGDTIKAVSALNENEAAARGAAPKRLAITQTNITSGAEISPYQQDSIYAGLWWASVLSEVIGSGKVAYINWFKSLDEGPYVKGLMRCVDKKCKLKPVGEIMALINASLLPQTLDVSSSAHEVRAFAVANEAGQVRLVIVNTSRRRYGVTVSRAAGLCVLKRTTISDQDNNRSLEIVSQAVAPAAGAFDIPARAIQIVEGRNASCADAGSGSGR